MTNKQAILFFVGIVAVATVAIFIWGSNMLKGVEEDDQKSKTLAVNIQHLFSNGNSIDKFPLQPANPDWQGKYIVLENLYTDNVAARYSTKWNEQLGVVDNFPGNDVKGVVMIANWIEIEGAYEGSLGIPTDTKPSRHSYVISYLDVASKAVLARDTLIGEDPPTRVRRGESGMGDAPDDDLVVAAIKKRMN